VTDDSWQGATAGAAGLRRFRLADVPAQPWKNGGGRTREIASWPPGAGLDDFLWRISVARIETSGPFSVFAGVDRVITLLDGPGVVLRGGFPEGEHALTEPLAPFAFPGDVAVDCEMRGAASEDLNVMSRRGRVRARVSVLHGPAGLPPAGCGMLLAARGAWLAEPAMEGVPLELEPGAGAWWGGAPHGWRLRPAAGRVSGQAAALVAVVFDRLAADGGASQVQDET